MAQTATVTDHAAANESMEKALAGGQSQEI